MEALVKDFSIDIALSKKESDPIHKHLGGKDFRPLFQRLQYKHTRGKDFRPLFQRLQYKHTRGKHFGHLFQRRKFNFYQVEVLSEILTSNICLPSSPRSNSDTDNSSGFDIWSRLFKSLESAYKMPFTSCSQRAQQANYITLQSENRKHFSERIKEELKKYCLPFSEAQTNTKSSFFFDSLSKKNELLSRTQIKNLIKRLISWKKLNPRKVKLVVVTLIKSIITPKLFGIYVSEEENNRLAIPASLIVRF